MPGWAIIISSSVIAAFVGAIASLLVAWVNRAGLDRRIKADIAIATQKLVADREQSLSANSWADYELRRDAYIEIAEKIDCLFESQNTVDRSDFHKAARKIRVIGSDPVVRALNQFTAGVIRKDIASHDREVLFRNLFNAIRKDIRQFSERPPDGTELGPEAFPLES